MKTKIRKCPRCGKYTMKELCDVCNIKTKIAHPAKFSPDDPYLLHKIKIIAKSKYGITI